MSTSNYCVGQCRHLSDCCSAAQLDDQYANPTGQYSHWNDNNWSDNFHLGRGDVITVHCRMMIPLNKKGTHNNKHTITSQQMKKSSANVKCEVHQRHITIWKLYKSHYKGNKTCLALVNVTKCSPLVWLCQGARFGASEASNVCGSTNGLLGLHHDAGRRLTSHVASQS